MRSYTRFLAATLRWRVGDAGRRHRDLRGLELVRPSAADRLHPARGMRREPCMSAGAASGSYAETQRAKTDEAVRRIMVDSGSPAGPDHRRIIAHRQRELRKAAAMCG